MAIGVARAGWDLDLSFGEERERALAAALGDCHFESKSDQKARETGNTFVETHQQIRGDWRPSGINTSTAGWWAIEVLDEVWVLLRRVALRELARRCPARLGGDQNRYRGRLVPVRWLIQRSGQ